MIESLKHWRQRVDASRIHWLTLDKADSAVNALSQEVLEELAALLVHASEQPARGIVLCSAKKTGFVVGADIGEFTHLRDAEQGAQLARRGQELLARLAASSIPSVAAIDGFALGGGLELALACHYRIAVKRSEPTLGFPEVQLGIHPGFGGTVRSVELLGAPVALDLMLTGRSITPDKARSLGLVDRVVGQDELSAVAAELVERRPLRARAAWYLRALALGPLRKQIAARVRSRVAKRVRVEHYPAPYAIVDLWEQHGARGEAAYAAEARSIGKLLVTPTCRNLVRVFYLRERLRGLASKEVSVSRVHVVGAGVMGGDIASWCALRGLDVTLQDTAQKYIDAALERAQKTFERFIRSPEDRAAAAGRLRSDIAAERIGSADVVIEAIIEKLEAKQSLFEKLEPMLADAAILATNTSSIKLEDMAVVLKRPERFVGLHFFNPVPRLPLVEVISGDQTSAATAAHAMSFVTQIGKLPLPCRSAPGFVVNRILAPYMLEALRAHEQGHSLEQIDEAAESFGMPMGPIELADRVGLDVAQHVSAILSRVTGLAVPDSLRDKVENGHLGAKTGEGFYKYENGRPIKQRPVPRSTDPDLQDRLILTLLNEAVACCEDGVVEDYDLLDAGAVFGTGFAPFRGGPVHYARARGVAVVVARLEDLAQKYGPRFCPHAGWQNVEQ